MPHESRKMRNCMIVSCEGDRRNLVHKFPADPIRAEEWRSKINDPKLKDLSLDTIRKRMFVCSRHFRKQDYKHAESRDLNKTAVPSLHLEPVGSKDKPTSTLIRGPIRFQDTQRINVISNQSETLRFELKFDTAELLDPSNLRVDVEPNMTDEYLIEDPILDDGMLSIVEQSPLQTDTYTLKNGSTIYRKRRLDNAIVSNDRYTIQKGAKQRLQGQEEEVVVMSLSSELFCELENRLQQQQRLQSSTKQNAIAQRNNENDEYNTDGLFSDAYDTVDSADECNLNEHIEDDMDSDVHVQDQLISNVTFANYENTDELCEDEPYVDENIAVHNLDNLMKDNQQLTPDQSIVSATRIMATTETPTNNEDFTTITLPNGTVLPEICNFWLRDHCRCADCYNTETSQRKLSVMDIPMDIKPISVQVLDNQLHVRWIDDHLSIYELDQLKKWLDIDQVANVTPTVLWTKTEIEKSAYARVTLNDYLCDDSVANSIVASLIRFGVAFIEKVPANVQSTEMVVKRLFPVQKTFFGEMWSFSDNKDHADTAYSKSYLGAHTDNTYFNDAAGLQVLHCIQHTGTGGESLLVDGFNALENLARKNPDSYQRLCETNVPAEYIEEKQHHTHCAPIICLHPITKQPVQIRFNLYDRSPMTSLPQRQMRTFYTDVKHLTAEVKSPDNEWWFKLNPGTVVLFDNWRVLHGRAEYTGRRQIAGCYVSRTEFQSVARTMGLIS